MPDTITIGGIAAPIYECPPEWQFLVPPEEEYVPQGHEEQDLAMAYVTHTPIMFTGPAGCGKDALIRSFCARINRPHFLLSFAEGTGLDQLIGSVIPVPLKTGFTVEFRKGALPLSIIAGGFFNGSEINMADPRVITRMNDFLATGQRLTLYEDPTNDGRYISPVDPVTGKHNGWMMATTVNPADSGQYNGAQELNAATDDRFAHVELDYLGMVNPDLEAKLIAKKTGIRESKAKRIVTVFNTIRQRSRMSDADIAKHDSQPIFAVASTRAAIRVAMASQRGMPIMRAVEWGFTTELNIDDRPVVHKLFLDEFASDGGNG